MRDFLPRPAIAPAAVWTFPTPRRARLSNGIELMIFELPGQHVISAHLVLDVPLNAEGRAIEGVATVCARTLDEGSLRHDGDEFAELLETEGQVSGSISHCPGCRPCSMFPRRIWIVLSSCSPRR